jgi:hypothetical protein
MKRGKEKEEQRHKEIKMYKIEVEEYMKGKIKREVTDNSFRLDDADGELYFVIKFT